jgi:hypothetical protein
MKQEPRRDLRDQVARRDGTVPGRHPNRRRILVSATRSRTPVELTGASVWSYELAGGTRAKHGSTSIVPIEIAAPSARRPRRVCHTKTAEMARQCG